MEASGAGFARSPCIAKAPVMVDEQDAAENDAMPAAVRTDAIAKLRRAASQREIRRISPRRMRVRQVDAAPQIVRTNSNADAIPPSFDRSGGHLVDGAEHRNTPWLTPSTSGDVPRAQSSDQLTTPRTEDNSPLPSLEQLRRKILQERKATGLSRSASASTTSRVARAYTMQKLLGATTPIPYNDVFEFIRSVNDARSAQAGDESLASEPSMDFESDKYPSMGIQAESTPPRNAKRATLMRSVSAREVARKNMFQKINKRERPPLDLSKTNYPSSTPTPDLSKRNSPIAFHHNPESLSSVQKMANDANNNQTVGTSPHSRLDEGSAMERERERENAKEQLAAHRSLYSRNLSSRSELRDGSDALRTPTTPGFPTSRTPTLSPSYSLRQPPSSAPLQPNWDPSSPLESRSVPPSSAISRFDSRPYPVSPAGEKPTLRIPANQPQEFSSGITSGNPAEATYRPTNTIPQPMSAPATSSMTLPTFVAPSTPLMPLESTTPNVAADEEQANSPTDPSRHREGAVLSTFSDSSSSTQPHHTFDRPASPQDTGNKSTDSFTIPLGLSRQLDAEAREARARRMRGRNAGYLARAVSAGGNMAPSSKPGTEVLRALGDVDSTATTSEISTQSNNENSPKNNREFKDGNTDAVGLGILAPATVSSTPLPKGLHAAVPMRKPFGSVHTRSASQPQDKPLPGLPYPLPVSCTSAMQSTRNSPELPTQLHSQPWPPTQQSNTGLNSAPNANVSNAIYTTPSFNIPPRRSLEQSSSTTTHSRASPTGTPAPLSQIARTSADGLRSSGFSRKKEPRAKTSLEQSVPEGTRTDDWSSDQLISVPPIAPTSEPEKKGRGARLLGSLRRKTSRVRLTDRSLSKKQGSDSMQSAASSSIEASSVSLSKTSADSIASTHKFSRAMVCCQDETSVLPSSAHLIVLPISRTHLSRLSAQVAGSNEVGAALARCLPGEVPYPDFVDPARELIRVIPVLQVAAETYVKLRYLYLFSDLLVISKPAHVPLQPRELSSYILSRLQSQPDLHEPCSPIAILPLHDTFLEPGAMVRAATEQIDRAGSLPHLSALQVQLPSKLPSIVGDIRRAPPDSTSLAQVLFVLPELDRAVLSRYLYEVPQRAVLHCYIAEHRLRGLPLEYGLRMVLLDVCFPSNLVEFKALLRAFAVEWIQANRGELPSYFTQALAIELTMALMTLNDALHSSSNPHTSSAPGMFSRPNPNISIDQFVRSVRAFDSQMVLSDRELREMYLSVKTNFIVEASTTAVRRILYNTRAVSEGLTVGVPSAPITVAIDSPDPCLRVRLLGKDLFFDPPVLSFHHSSRAEFIVGTTSPGEHEIVFLRLGSHAPLYPPVTEPCGSYHALPRSLTIFSGLHTTRPSISLRSCSLDGISTGYQLYFADTYTAIQCAGLLLEQIATLASRKSNPNSAQAISRKLADQVLQACLRFEERSAAQGKEACLTGNDLVRLVRENMLLLGLFSKPASH
ncbi:hypothetical protein MYAM1_001796 [Malassezia yamatoensis]|uniref:SEC7 domain-containing protein n=1 Tax=Malassezia yamatoensis TaxID=253288 RepID=A0AAJ5YRZ5_9BASI|nr:hypothetical protein MYAM1_001796 [Malassezia yamatoensis]